MARSNSDSESKRRAQWDRQRAVMVEIGQRVRQQFAEMPKTTRKEAAFLSELVKGGYSPLVAKQLGGGYSSDSHRVVRSLRGKGLAISYGRNSGVVHAGLALDTAERPSVFRHTYLEQCILLAFSGWTALGMERRGREWAARRRMGFAELRRAVAKMHRAAGRGTWQGDHAERESQDVEFQKSLKRLVDGTGYSTEPGGNAPPRLFKDELGYRVNSAAWPADAWFPRPFSAV